MSKIIDDLNWRYATKRFDSSQKISGKDIKTIKESLRLVPSSYGLQPLKFILVENPELREKLVKASYNQRQVQDASHLLVICSSLKMTDKHIDDFMENVADTRNVALETTSGYANFVKSTVNAMEDKNIERWNQNQAYIALGQLLHTCASLRIDATPMEGFIAEQYAEILDIDLNEFNVTLVCPMGYRHEEDETQHLKKVRKSLGELFEVK